MESKIQDELPADSDHSAKSFLMRMKWICNTITDKYNEVRSIDVAAIKSNADKREKLLMKTP